MPQVAPLRGWYVISLRPLGRHGGVRAAAARLGARCVAVSTLRTEPLHDDAALAAALAATARARARAEGARHLNLDLRGPPA
jgi:hypothetical protein